MKILIVSDTHGRDDELDKVLEIEKPFDMLVHCGDVEGREIYIEVAAECPCHIITGNNDFFSDLPREEEIRLGVHKVFLTHGHYYGVSRDLRDLVEEAASRGCDIAMFGHTHKPLVEVRQGVTVINPGSLSYPRQIGRLPSYAVMDLKQNGLFEVEIRYLEK